jgi:hypothetical protein
MYIITHVKHSGTGAVLFPLLCMMLVQLSAQKKKQEYQETRVAIKQNLTISRFAWNA